MDDLLYNVSPIRKSGEKNLNLERTLGLDFLPRDFFFAQENLVAFRGARVKLYNAWGSIDYHFQIPDTDSMRLSLHSSDLGQRFAFHDDIRGDYLFCNNELHKIGEGGGDVLGLMMREDELLRFSKKESKIMVERAAITDDGILPWRRDEALSKINYDRLLLTEQGCLFMRFAEDPLPGSYIRYLDKDKGELFPEIYLPTRLGSYIYAVSDDRVYFVERSSLHAFSLSGERIGSEIDLQSIHIKSIAAEKDQVLLLDFNNFLHFYKRGKKEKDLKLPGNLYGLALHNEEVYLADRKAGEIKAYRLN